MTVRTGWICSWSEQPRALRCHTWHRGRGGETWWSLIRQGFSQLLHDPYTSRMTRDIEVENAPPIMTNDEKAVKQAEGGGRHDKKSVAAMASR